MFRQHCRSLGEGGGEGGIWAEQPPPPDVSAGRMSSPVIQTARWRQAAHTGGVHVFLLSKEPSGWKKSKQTTQGSQVGGRLADRPPFLFSLGHALIAHG